MTHPLRQQIARVRRQVRLLVWVHGLCLLLAATLGAALVVGLIDYLCHFSLPLRRVFADPGIRVICSLVVAGVFGWVAYRWVLRGARARFADVALASRVEGRFPDLHDRLTSAVEFLGQGEDDAQAGSPELRRAVIAQTTAAVEQLRLSQAIDYRPMRRAAIAVGAVLALTVTAVLLSPSAAGTALARLVNPLGGPDWPQETRLQFQQEITRAATGKPLELVVEDKEGKPLPGGVRLFVRFDGETAEHSFPMRSVDGAAVYRFASVTRPLTYWAEGGDDLSMRQRPIHLEVIEPPEVRSLAVELHPPAYTGWPAVKSEKHIRALEGTRVAFEGTSNKPLQTAILCFQPAGNAGAKKEAAPGGAAGAQDGNETKDAGKLIQVPAEITSDGCGFRLATDAAEAFIVSSGGQYWFRLEDIEGIVGDDAPHEIRAVADLPPTVRFEEPAKDEQYTPAAVVPLRIAVKDDLALRGATLQIFIASPGADAKPAHEIVLATADAPPSQPMGLGTDKLGDVRSILHELPLKEIIGEAVSGRQKLTLVVSASDFRPQTGRSSELHLTIVTPNELENLAVDRQRAILQKLYEVLVTQRTGRKELAGVEARFQKVGRLEKTDLDGLERSKLAQDRVNDGLSNEASGVASQIERLLAYLRQNRADGSQVTLRMRSVLTEIRRLEREHLGTIVGNLRDAGKAAQSKLDSPDQQRKTVGDNLASAGKGQDEVIAALEGLLGNMTDWDHFSRLKQELIGLRRDHENIMGQAAKLAPETLTKDYKDLTPQQQGELARLARGQQDVLRALGNILQRMGQMRSELGKKDPAGVLEDALHHARSSDVSSDLKGAAENLARNQLGKAAQRQQAANTALGEMLDILAQRPEHDRSRLVQRLRQAEQELQNLANRQKGLKKKMQEAAANPDEAQKRRELARLAEEQRRLEAETERLARKLQRLQAQQAGAQASSAAGQMGKAGDQSQQGDAAGAEKSAQQALEDLEQAGQELADARRQAEVELALELLAKISDELTGLKTRQQSLSAETQRLDKLRLDQIAARQQFTDGQKESVRNLSRQEDDVRQAALQLAEKLAEAAVFQAALQGAARELELAAEQLAQLKTGTPTQTAQRNAERRFGQLVEALKPEPPDNSKNSDGGGNKGGGSGKQQSPPKNGIPSVAQLKLLKMMQLELNDRTRELDARLAGRKPEEIGDVERRERDLVSQQQGEVARLTLNLSRRLQAAAGGEGDDPEKLPDFSPDEADKKLDSRPPGAKNLGGPKENPDGDPQPPANPPRPRGAKEPS